MSRRVPLTKTVSANAKALREASQKTQPQVAATAREAGYTIDQGTISRIERGKIVPSLDVLEALAAGLDAEPWQLLVPDLDARNPTVLADPGERQRAFWKQLEKVAKEAGVT